MTEPRKIETLTDLKDMMQKVQDEVRSGMATQGNWEDGNWMTAGHLLWIIGYYRWPHVDIEAICPNAKGAWRDFLTAINSEKGFEKAEYYGFNDHWYDDNTGWPSIDTWGELEVERLEGDGLNNEEANDEVRKWHKEIASEFRDWCKDMSKAAKNVMKAAEGCENNKGAMNSQIVMTGQAVPGWIKTDDGSYVNPLAIDRYEVHEDGLTLYKENGKAIATLTKPTTFANALATLRVMSKFKSEKSVRRIIKSMEAEGELAGMSDGLDEAATVRAMTDDDIVTASDGLSYIRGAQDIANRMRYKFNGHYMDEKDVHTYIADVITIANSLSKATEEFKYVDRYPKMDTRAIANFTELLRKVGEATRKGDTQYTTDIYVESLVADINKVLEQIIEGVRALDSRLKAVRSLAGDTSTEKVQEAIDRIASDFMPTGADWGRGWTPGVPKTVGGDVWGELYGEVTIHNEHRVYQDTLDTTIRFRFKANGEVDIDSIEIEIDLRDVREMIENLAQDEAVELENVYGENWQQAADANDDILWVGQNADDWTEMFMLTWDDTIFMAFEDYNRNPTPIV